MDNLKPIELRSEKVRNIIGIVPPILIRSGIIAIFLIIISLFFAVYFIPYKENIKTGIIITESGKSFYAKGYLPYTYFVQVKPETQVKVELEGYNSSSFGYMNGKIIKIDPRIVDISDKHFFEIIVELKRDSIIQSGMKGNAIILFSNKTILEKILPNKKRNTKKSLPKW